MSVAELEELTPAARQFAVMKGVVAAELYEETLAAASALRGLRVTFVNSNQNRGGVFEHLWSLVPLMNDLGLHARWFAVSEVPPDFYDATRLVYNGLQGDEVTPTNQDWSVYESVNESVGQQLRRLGGDAVLVQDHQFVASRQSGDSQQRWVWQSHSETSSPTPSVASRFETYLQPYDGYLFYCPDYLFGVADVSKARFSTIAIDPTSEKNSDMPLVDARKRVARFGVDPSRPLVTQVSRVDVWKDFPGVVEAWLVAREVVPDLQLAIVGSVTPNNVRADGILATVRSMLRGTTGAQVLINTVPPRDIKAFQIASDVVLQNSLREGFGLTVSEALWSETPVVGRDVGGIRLQVVDGECGYLIESASECGERIVDLVTRPALAQQMGRAGRERVRKEFVLPRLIRDELRLLADIVADSE